MGEVVDFTAKTVACRARHVEKLRMLYAKSFNRDCTFADLFGLYGMLYYMSDTLGLRIDKRLRTRLFFSTLARRLANEPSLWQQPAQVRPPSADIGAWVAEALANKPARVCRLPHPDTVIIGDACRMGYAGVVVHRLPSGELTTAMFQHPWRRRLVGTLDYGLSTVSEPEAAARLLDETRRIFPSMVPLYVTDHEPFVQTVCKSVEPTFLPPPPNKLDC
jgi:hypothetical protein